MNFGIPDTFNQFGGAAITGLRVILIAVGAFIATTVIQRAIRTFRERIARRFDDREAVQRAETLGRAARYMAAVVITAMAAMLILGELGISLAPVLGAAGVVGLAIGFGAQSLVKDYFGGFFLLLENQIRQGDVVKLGDHAGLVEEMTLRYVRLRDYDGNVHFVSNGEIKVVVNMSRGFAQAVIAVGIAYRESVDEALEVMREVGAQMRADAALAPLLLEDLEIAGVDGWADSAVTLRCRFKCVPLQQWAIRREFLRRLKRAFDERGIEIPYPHLTVYAGQDKQGTAPAWPLRIVRAAAQPGTTEGAGQDEDFGEAMGSR
jgi:small conductance mechanosensitive channel